MNGNKLHRLTRVSPRKMTEVGKVAKQERNRRARLELQLAEERRAAKRALRRAYRRDWFYLLSSLLTLAAAAVLFNLAMASAGLLAFGASTALMILHYREKGLIAELEDSV